MDNKKNVGNISKYGTFGLHEEWLEEYFLDSQITYWVKGNNSLGVKQIPSFKAWLKDAEIIDDKNLITPFGEFCAENIINDSELIWSLIWINLSYNSELVKWFVNNVNASQLFNSTILAEQSMEHFASSFSRTTIEYAFQALVQVFNYSPIGDYLLQGEKVDKKSLTRNEYTGISEVAVAYSLYKFAERNNAYSLRVKDFYDTEYENGVAKEFCLSSSTFEKALRTLNSAKDRVLIAELNMGLNHITLMKELTSLDVIKRLF